MYNNYNGNDYNNQKNNFFEKLSINKVIIVFLFLIIIALLYFIFFKNNESRTIKVTSINFPKGNLSLKVGSTFDLSNHIILDSSNSTLDKITYYNGDSSILNVSDKGIIQTLSQGNDEITIMINGNIEKKISVTVSDNGTNSFADETANQNLDTIQSIEFDQPEIITDKQGKTQLKMKKGEQYILIPKIVPDNVVDGKLDYIVSENDFVTLVPSVDGKSVTINAANKTGTVTLTVKSSNNIVKDLIIIIEEEASIGNNTNNSVSPLANCEAKVECLNPTYTGQEIPFSSIVSCENCSVVKSDPRYRVGSPDKDTFYELTVQALECPFINSDHWISIVKVVTCPILKQK